MWTLRSFKEPVRAAFPKHMANPKRAWRGYQFRKTKQISFENRKFWKCRNRTNLEQGMISNRPPHIQILNKIKIFALILHKATRQQHSPKCNVHSEWSDSLIKSKWSYIFICQLEKTQGLTPRVRYLGGLSSEMLVNHDAFSWAPFPRHLHPNYTATATYKNGHRKQKRLVLARNILYLSWSHLKDISRFSPPQISKPGSYSPREVKYFLHRNNTMLCFHGVQIIGKRIWISFQMSVR